MWVFQSTAQNPCQQSLTGFFWLQYLLLHKHQRSDLPLTTNSPISLWKKLHLNEKYWVVVRRLQQGPLMLTRLYNDLNIWTCRSKMQNLLRLLKILNPCKWEAISRSISTAILSWEDVLASGANGRSCKMLTESAKELLWQQKFGPSRSSDKTYNLLHP